MPESATGPKAWIDYPKDGTSMPLGVPITVISHSFAGEGVAEVMLSVDGVPYRRDPPKNPGDDFTQTRQEWLPSEVGTHTLQVWTYDMNGETGQPATLSISVIGEEVVEPDIPPTLTYTPEISITPTLTFTNTDTPTITPTETLPPSITPTESLTPSLTPSLTASLTPTYTPSPTPLPPDTTPPPAPILEVPADGLIVSCRSTQTLAWQPVEDPSGIAGYYIELEREVRKGEWDDAGRWGPITDKQIEVPVNCGVSYRWAVRAEDGAGHFSEWSGVFSFGVTLD